ncbi:hypothetical protein LF1_03510 [Rubripirellula obstinata]|uniref:Uncharacterized protein n=1 Tax=Rubripirellula obstinata TaxID=406547 RepID=A0A5B1CC99_9BACT|nr:hypothetical protein LF1_03510 [Rubripirellula obstinata]
MTVHVIEKSSSPIRSQQDVALVSMKRNSTECSRHRLIASRPQSTETPQFAKILSMHPLISREEISYYPAGGNPSGVKGF